MPAQPRPVAHCPPQQKQSPGKWRPREDRSKAKQSRRAGARLWRLVGLHDKFAFFMSSRRLRLTRAQHRPKCTHSTRANSRTASPDFSCLLKLHLLSWSRSHQRNDPMPRGRFKTCLPTSRNSGRSPFPCVSGASLPPQPPSD